MTTNLNSIDDLFAAGMDDIADLPPMGVPPSGHYNLLVTIERKQGENGKGEYLSQAFEVTAINEVKDPAEADQVAVGMKFNSSTSVLTKEGKLNEYGLGLLKELVAPFAAHFGAGSFGEAIQHINKVECCAVLTRTKNRKNADQFNFRLSDITVL